MGIALHFVKITLILVNCLKINEWKWNRDIFLTFCMPGTWIRRRRIFEPATVATVRVIVLHPPSCNLLRFDVQRTALSAPRFKEYRVPFVSEARPEATYNWPKVCPWQFSFLYLPFASVLLVRTAPRLALFPRIFPSPGLSLHPLSSWHESTKLLCPGRHDPRHFATAIPNHALRFI